MNSELLQCKTSTKKRIIQVSPIGNCRTSIKNRPMAGR